MPMTLNITVPDAQANRVIHALCKQADIDETPANAKATVIKWMTDTVRSVENDEARQAAVNALPPDITAT